MQHIALIYEEQMYEAIYAFPIHFLSPPAGVAMLAGATVKQTNQASNDNWNNN